MLEAALIGLIAGWVTRRVIKSYEKDTTKAKPTPKKLSQADEELITTILPVINNGKWRWVVKTWEKNFRSIAKDFEKQKDERHTLK